MIRADDTAGTRVEIRGASERLAGIAQTLTLSTGQRFVPFEELPSGFLGAADTGVSRWTEWLERFSPVKAAVLVAVLALAILGLRAAVPIAADLAAVMIPDRVETFIGRQAISRVRRDAAGAESARRLAKSTNRDRSASARAAGRNRSDSSNPLS